MTATEPTTAVPDEIDADATFHALVRRLSVQSVNKHFDAYDDIAWDDPDYAIDPTDPRWELRTDDPLGGTDWYRSLPQETRARVGLHSIVAKMKVGLEFENVLARGLLEYINTLPNGAPEFRYAHHEIIEEGQHQLMFQEFINRSGLDPAGMPWDARLGTRFVIMLGKYFPELFFMFVLGGEDPIDHVQRQSLERDDNHPLMDRIMRIHVTEEARHLSFARNFLKNRIGAMSKSKKTALAVGTPLILGEMGAMMLQPSKQMIDAFDIPAHVLDEAYTNNPEYLTGAATALRKVRKLSRELGLLDERWVRKIWIDKKIYADD